MWRSIIIYNGERLSLEMNSLVVTKDKKDVKIPIDDLYCIVIDQYETIVTIPVLERLVSEGVAVIICNDKHLPTCCTLPINNNYRSYKVLKEQLSWSKEWKDNLWKLITAAKIRNQAKVLMNANCDAQICNRMLEFSNEVVIGDLGNREGIAAKMFFRNLYGTNFTRFADDAINVALNYGYAILRSCMATALISCGFNLCIGVHHISETNSYNLADDLMEPFRALIDQYVDKHHLDIDCSLSKEIKNGLVNILNEDVVLEGKITKVRYAIVETARSLVSCIEKENYNCIKLPEIICQKEEE